MAAVEADRVVVALIGDTSKLDAPVNNSARQFDQNMSKIEKSATRAEGQIIRSSGAIQNAQRNIARQLQDAGAQAGSGQSLLTILIQQAPQAADAMVDLGGKAGAVGRFFLNPWVAAAVAAASALTPLIANSIKFGNETDKLVEKMRKQAREAELTEAAQKRFQNSLEGVTQAARDDKKALDDLADSDKTAADRANQNAQAHLAKAVAIRKSTAAAVAAAEAELRLANSSAESGLAGTAAAEKLKKAQEDLKKANEAVASEEQSLARSRGEVAVEQANRAATAAATTEGRITSEYERQKKLLEDKAKAEIAATSELKKQQAIANRLGVDLLRLQRQRDKDLKDAQASSRTTNSQRVTLPLPASGPITSGFGARTAPTKGASTFHPAIDIGVPVGTQVRAGASGVVVYAGKMGGLGNVVIVDYGNGTIAEFGHLSQTLAKRGQQVNAGDVVALSGNTGVSTGPHLDYRLRTGARVENGRVVGGKYVDPRKPVSVAGGDAIANAEDAAAKAVQKIHDDFDGLWDDLQRGAEQAREKIASDFNSLENALDPAAAAADQLAKRLEVIEKARLTGIIDDARAAQVAFLSMSDALGPLFSVSGAASGAGSDLAKATADGVSQGIDVANERAREQIYTLADFYESAFSGGTKSVWELFKREAFRALALIAAQQTFKAITGQSAPQTNGGGSDFFSTLLSFGAAIFGKGSSTKGLNNAGASLGKFFGRASGGYVGPGQTVRVNEHRGGVELLRMGAQGGTVIPLGQTRAASPAQHGGNTYNISVSADNSVTPAGFARGLAAQILNEAQKMDAKTAQSTLRAVPARLAQWENDERR